MHPSFPRTSLFAVAGAAGGVLLACSHYDGEVCTAEFRGLPLTIVSESGTPVTDATVTTRLTRNNQVLQTTGDSPTGWYVILTDSSAGRLRSGGDSVSAAVSASIDTVLPFVISGGCHIAKLSGPDSLVVP